MANRQPPPSTPPGTPNPTPGPSTGNGSGAGDFPPALKWAVALIVIGGLSEWLYRSVSPTAGYSLVAIVVLGYAAQPGHISNVTAFFNKVGIT